MVSRAETVSLPLRVLSLSEDAASSAYSEEEEEDEERVDSLAMSVTYLEPCLGRVRFFFSIQPDRADTSPRLSINGLQELKLLRSFFLRERF